MMHHTVQNHWDLCMRQRLARILLSDLTSLRWLLGWLAIVFALGLLFANSHVGAYNVMLDLAPPVAWSVMFALYGFTRLYSCCTDNPRYSVILGAFLGFWLWCYTFVSFTSNTIRSIGSADIMVLVVVVCEVWVAASAISEYRTK